MGMTGVEPASLGLKDRCITDLLHTHKSRTGPTRSSGPRLWAGAGAQWAPLSTDRAGRRDPERSEDRTRKLHERMILRHARFPVSHLGIVVQEKGFEPSKLCY